MIVSKRAVSRLLAMGMIFPFCCMLLFSCGGNKDEAIREAIEAKKKEMKELAALTTSVEKGVVTISGECPDKSTESICVQSISSIPGVKNVVDNLTVTPPPATAPAPVVIAPDDPLTRGVADAVKDYPGVSATVKDGEVTLTGDIKRASLQKLMKSLHSLKPRKINNQLTVK
ncbi:MAG TPA: BON domain-containing protein [Puia sp.]|nr:BON domain-containing protein [Puia sp.]